MPGTACTAWHGLQLGAELARTRGGMRLWQVLQTAQQLLAKYEVQTLQLELTKTPKSPNQTCAPSLPTAPA